MIPYHWWFQIKRTIRVAASKGLRLGFSAPLKIALLVLAGMSIGAALRLDNPERAQVIQGAAVLAVAMYLSQIAWFLILALFGMKQDVPWTTTRIVSAGQVLRSSNPFVLYLRNFEPERSASIQKRTVQRPARIVRTGGPGGPFRGEPMVIEGGPEETWDIVLRPIERQLLKLLTIRVVALANADDPTPPEGMTLVAVEMEHWEQTAEALMRAAECVVLAFKALSDGIGRELELLQTTGAVAKTVLLVDGPRQPIPSIPAAATLEIGHGTTEQDLRTLFEGIGKESLVQDASGKRRPK